jgi:hypothetical protein
MTLQRFGARLARIEPAVRSTYAIDPNEPTDPNMAIYWAIEHDRVRPRHLEALWNQYGAGLRDVVINAVPQRRVDRLARERAGKPEPWVYDATYQAVELLSYRPDESPTQWTLGPIKAYATLPIDALPGLYRLGGDAGEIQKHVMGLLMMRILVTPDAIQLRRHLWETGPAPATSYSD